MARPMNSDAFDELLACYALGAIDDDDRRTVEERLATDPEARERLEAYERAVMVAANEVGPPDHVWDHLTRAAFPGALRVPHPRRLAGRANRRARATRRVAEFAAVGCLAALATGVAFAVIGDHSSSTNLPAIARAAENAPGARRSALRRPDGTVAASAVVLPNGSGYLTSHLARLGSGRTYQLWARGNTTISLGVLGAHPQTVAFTLVGAPRLLLITDEPSPGVPLSHQPPSAAGELGPA
jgi:anti-sigma factor RsiW